MSPKARRLAGSVVTDRFQWQGAVPKHTSFPRPIALVFSESGRETVAVADPNQDIEAREMQLPSVSEERLQTIEQEAFAKGYASGERAVAVVRLNPLDYATLSPVKSDEAGTINLVADPAVPRGGCRIESACGEIDAGIDAQIAELSRELLPSGTANEPSPDDTFSDV